MRVAPLLLEAGKKIVDLSADFRLKDPAVYKEWYKAEHIRAAVLADAVYGLPELYKSSDRQVRACSPTPDATSRRRCWPWPHSGDHIDLDSIIVDSLSGVSGAGRSKFGLDYHFSEVNESVRPYGVGGTHRHTPEIEQALSWQASSPSP